MSLMLSIQGAKKVADGIYSATLIPAEVRRLGDVQHAFGKRSVVGLAGHVVLHADGYIAFSPGSASVLNVGSSDTALIVELNGSESSEEIAREAVAPSPATIRPPQQFRAGDNFFLEDCQNLLTDPLPSMAKQIIVAVRNQHSGKLREGKARKWVNYPDNFLAMTIQTRDRSFAIHIKGRPGDFDAPTLELKPDRPGYSRFKLQRQDQLEDTVKVILASARRTTEP